ncbi:hypothetical protein [Emticicia sp. BO119]|uniref:hypothetical protein n=1 Tax=Emticicia sp. BO119 TaxID=2757768 RepID=UPI0015F0C980|nr:hypothetical protein [Emticicia sp. BO119]MBA4849491.1 hypothetical protein [Emticicia sp. BO119]
MKKKIRNKIIGAVSIIGVVGITVAIIRYFSKKKSTPVILDKSSTVVVGASGGGGSGTGTPNVPPSNTLSAFTIKKAYLDNGIYLSYVSIDEALDKNLDEEVTNQNGTVYTTSMDDGSIAFNEVSGNTFYPTGFYFYEPTTEMLLIDQQGVMHFYHDIDKNGLNAQPIKDGTV